MPASVAKGLEFDRVVVVEPAAIVAAEPDERTGLRRLYVVLTRAVSGLTVVHSRAPAGRARSSRLRPSDRLRGCPRCSPGGPSTSSSSRPGRTPTRWRRIGTDLRRRCARNTAATTRHAARRGDVLALEELEDEGALGDREAALARLAACFHDAVYDPAAPPGANEADSAELAVRDLRALGCP